MKPGGPHRACGACGLWAGPSTSGPPSWPHHSWVSRAEELQPQPEGSRNLKLGKPKPTPGLVSGHHGDRETWPLSSMLSLRARRLPGREAGRSSLLRRLAADGGAKLRLGGLDQRLLPLSDSWATSLGLSCPLPRGLFTAISRRNPFTVI